MRTISFFLPVLLACGCAMVEAERSATQQAAIAPVTMDSDPLAEFLGVWGYRNRTFEADAEGNAFTTFPARDGSVVNFETDFAVLERAEENMPIYKPEHWDLIRQKDYYGLGEDPVFTCLPAGVPRMGPPQRIARDGDTLIFLYTGQEDTYRVIPTDGRELTEEQLGDITWKGYSTGSWDGDKLVITSKAFNDASWLGWAGWVHSNEMVVTETVWVEDDALHWSAVVEDEMLLKPWHIETLVRPRTTDPAIFFWETPPCQEHDLEHIVDTNVRG